MGKKYFTQLKGDNRRLWKKAAPQTSIVVSCCTSQLISSCISNTTDYNAYFSSRLTILNSDTILGDAMMTSDDQTHVFEGDQNLQSCTASGAAGGDCDYDGGGDCDYDHE
jgi:hypothetical protein